MTEKQKIKLNAIAQGFKNNAKIGHFTFKSDNTGLLFAYYNGVLIAFIDYPVEKIFNDKPVFYDAILSKNNKTRLHRYFNYLIQERKSFYVEKYRLWEGEDDE